MGSRSNYAILENGQLLLYYSHWGALTVAEDIFFGPANTEEFIRKNQATTEWLDDVWAEGGIALDKDSKQLTYMYSEWPFEADVRRTYEMLLAEAWASNGWTVRCVRHWGDLADAVGVARSLVSASPSSPVMIGVDQLGTNLSSSFCSGLLSVWTAGGWDDRAIDVTLPGVLMNGPELLEKLDSIADIDELRIAFENRREDDPAKVLGDWIEEYCAINPLDRTLRVSIGELGKDRMRFVRDAWPGWSVFEEKGGATAHFGFTGRDVPTDLLPSQKPPEPDPPDRPHDVCVRLIGEHLANNENFKTSSLASHVRFVEEMNHRNGRTTIAPGFLERVPSSEPRRTGRLRHAIRLFLRKFRA